MIRKNKMLASVAAGALVLAACGSDDDAESEEEPASTEAASASEPAEDEAMEEDDAMEEEEATDEEPTDDGDEAASGDGDCASDEFLCVGLVTDVGQIDDKSFNQSAWEGVQASVADQFDFIETQDSTDYATNIATFVDQEYDIIVTVGFALGEATSIAAAENPEIDFIAVDAFQGEAVDNVAGLVFPEDQAGFLAGALAGLLTETNTVGAVLGTDLVPPVVAFKEGWENGARFTNPDVELISTYHPGGLDVAFTDPAFGADTARQAIDSGADVIFGAGGATGNGALAEIAKDGGEVFCVGVDTDQWETVPEAQPCLITSAVKNITTGVQDLIVLSADGEFPGGNFFGTVGLASFHDFADVIPQDVQDQIAELTPQVLDGTVETGYTPGG